jgi:hypothetical protein
MTVNGAADTVDRDANNTIRQRAMTADPSR